MADEVVLNKAETIEKCIKHIRDVYVACNKDLENNIVEQDSIILNIQRACEATIDLATRIVRVKQLGNPQSSCETFTLLDENKIITAELSRKLQAMVGFRNIAVHDYTSLNLDIVHAVIENNLNDLSEFSKQMIKHFS